MNYAVVWVPDAERELAALWNVSQRRSARAAADADRRLAANGSAEGESRSNGQRVMFAWPLTVIFQVDEANHVVTVGHVREHR